MPAWPSQSALKAALRQRIARGLWRRISRAQATPRLLELVDGHHLVHEPHVEGLLRVVLPAQVPDLARLLLAHDARHVGGAEARVEAAHPRPGLPEARVVGRDREVAHQVQHVAAADGVARHQGDHRLGERPDQALQVEDVEARHALVVHVAGVAAHPLVAARAEGLGPLAGEEHDADLRRPRARARRRRSARRACCGRKALRTSGRLMVILAMPSSLFSKRMSS